jgi:hypothetical protein
VPNIRPKPNIRCFLAAEYTVSSDRENYGFGRTLKLTMTKLLPGYFKCFIQLYSTIAVKKLILSVVLGADNNAILHTNHHMIPRPISCQRWFPYLQWCFFLLYLFYLLKRRVRWSKSPLFNSRGGLGLLYFRKISQKLPYKRCKFHTKNNTFIGLR